MADRYSRIIEASRMKKALDNYLLWLNGTADRQVGVGNGKARPATTNLYVKPFGVALNAKQYAQVSGNATYWGNNKTKFTSKKATIDEINAGGTTDESALKLKGFRAARVVHRTGMLETGKVSTSNVTKTKYLNYGGTSTSIPFGTNTVTPNSEAAQFEILKGEYTLDATQRVNWSREKY